jgi:uncharacterized membrane protein YkoI
MKNNLIPVGMLAAALVIAGATGCTTEKQKQAELQAEAKISKEQALATAQAKVPNGKITDSELEKEKGRLIWSFDMSTPDSKDTTEVNVDAISGDVVNVETESGKDKD